MSNFTTNYIGVNAYSRPGINLNAVRKIVVHYTANPGASAANHRTYFNNLRDRYASAHIFVDDKDAICIIPLNEVAYHANDVQKYVNGAAYRGVPALKPNANFLSIGVEMCIDKKSNITAATFNRAVNVVAELCKKYGLSASDVVRHYDITAKNCPKPFVDKPSEFTRFKNAVAAKLKGGASPASKTEFFDYAPKAIVITKSDGAGAYSDKELKKKVKHYPAKTKLTIKSVVKVGNIYRFLTIHGTYITANMAYVQVWNEPSKYKLKAQKGTFSPNTTVAVKKDPTVKAKQYSMRKKGDSISYSGYIEKDGYIWVAFHTKAGSLYYVPVRDSKTGKALGTFK